MAAQGLTTIKSSHSPRETMDRLEAAVTAKGLTVFARIDHAAGASAAGLSLRPTEVLVFGNAKGGTPLMQAVQTSGSTCRSRRWSGRTHRVKPGSPGTIRPGLRRVTAWPERKPWSADWRRLRTRERRRQ